MNVRNQVLEKSNDSVQTTLELIFDDTLFFKENEKANPMQNAGQFALSKIFFAEEEYLFLASYLSDDFEES